MNSGTSTLTDLRSCSSTLPLVVGTVHSPGALECALRLAPGEVDVLELRVDAFAADANSLQALEAAIPKLVAPLLLTVRHPDEGAAFPLTLERRKALFRQFLPCVQWADFEVRSLKTLRAEIAEAKALGVKLVVSDHHFKRTPSLAVLERRLAMARTVAPEAVKVAAALRSPKDLERLLSFLNQSECRASGRLSVMGMGALGQISRLVLGRCGSRLNYGYLDQPQVPGQWPAVVLKQRLLELAG